eukprot:6209490-Pleurochrysis_carterae.AAC.1
MRTHARAQRCPQADACAPAYAGTRVHARTRNVCTHSRVQTLNLSPSSRIRVQACTAREHTDCVTRAKYTRIP